MSQTVFHTALCSLTNAFLPLLQQLCTTPNLAALLTLGGFLLLLTGVGCLELVRKKRRTRAIAFCCMIPALIGLILASISVLTAWLSRQEEKNAAKSYLAYATTIDQTVAQQAYHEATAYNLALAENCVAQECCTLSDVDSVVAVLELPAIGQTLPVYAGVEANMLQHGAGLLPGSSLPVGGAGTHTVLVGCSGLLRAELFTDLKAFREGDSFYIHVLGRTLVYQVDAAQTVSAADTVFPLVPSVDQVTLVTSYADGAYFLVHGVRD